MTMNMNMNMGMRMGKGSIAVISIIVFILLVIPGVSSTALAAPEPSRDGIDGNADIDVGTDVDAGVDAEGVCRTRQAFTHTVFAEDLTGTWCGNCTSASETLKAIYQSGDYPFYFVSLIEDKNDDAHSRCVDDYNLEGYPTVEFDGGYREVIGAQTNESNYRSAIEDCGVRTTPAIDLEINAVAGGGATINVTTEVTNNGTTAYNGTLRVYMTEIVSRYLDADGNNYPFGFLDFAIEQAVTITPNSTATYQTDWDGAANSDADGNDFSDIAMDNIMVLGAMFNSEGVIINRSGDPPTEFTAYYVDEAVGATVTNDTQEDVNHPPSIEPIEDQTTPANATYQFQPTVLDPDAGDTHQFNLTTNATFLTIDPSTGEVSGEPAAADIGFYWVTINVSDENGSADAETYRLTVTEASADPPRVVASNPAADETGVPIDTIITVDFDREMDDSTFVASNPPAAPYFDDDPDSVFLFDLQKAYELDWTNQMEWESNVQQMLEPLTLTTQPTQLGITPVNDLENGVEYTVALTDAITDISGVPLETEFLQPIPGMPMIQINASYWNFTTVAEPLGVETTTPGDGLEDIDTEPTISATFNKALDETTVTDTNIYLRDSTGAYVDITVTLEDGDTTVAIEPAAPLAYGEHYTATISTVITDIDGTSLNDDLSWSFTVRPAPLTIVSVNPAPDADDIERDAFITARFARNIDPDTIAGEYTLEGPMGTVSVNHSYSASTATMTLQPQQPLDYETTYTVTLGDGIADRSGWRLDNDEDDQPSPYSWSFSTVSLPLNITATDPVHGAEDIPIDTVLEVSFNTGVDERTLVASTTVTLTTAAGSAVSGTLSYLNATHTMTFTPATDLDYETEYRMTIDSEVTDLNGAPLDMNADGVADEYEWSFTTALEPVAVVETEPESDATDVDATINPSITFNKPLIPTALDRLNFSLKPVAGGAGISGELRQQNRMVQFVPDDELEYDTAYRFTAEAGIRATDGAVLENEYAFEFTVADITEPEDWTADDYAQSYTDMENDLIEYALQDGAVDVARGDDDDVDLLSITSQRSDDKLQLRITVAGNTNSDAQYMVYFVPGTHSQPTIDTEGGSTLPAGYIPTTHHFTLTSTAGTLVGGSAGTSVSTSGSTMTILIPLTDLLDVPSGYGIFVAAQKVGVERSIVIDYAGSGAQTPMLAGDDTDTEEENEAGGLLGMGETVDYALIAALIAIIVVVLLIFIFRKRKTEEEPMGGAAPAPGEVGAEIGAEPGPAGGPAPGAAPTGEGEAGYYPEGEEGYYPEGEGEAGYYGEGEEGYYPADEGEAGYYGEGGEGYYPADEGEAGYYGEGEEGYYPDGEGEAGYYGEGEEDYYPDGEGEAGYYGEGEEGYYPEGEGEAGYYAEGEEGYYPEGEAEDGYYDGTMPAAGYEPAEEVAETEELEELEEEWEEYEDEDYDDFEDEGLDDLFAPIEDEGPKYSVEEPLFREEEEPIEDIKEMEPLDEADEELDEGEEDLDDLFGPIE